MELKTCIIALSLIVFSQPAATLAQGFPGPAEEAPAPKAATDSNVTSAQVEKAIARARSWLYSRERNGNWEESPTKQPVSAGGGGFGFGGGPMMNSGRGRVPEISSQWGGLSCIATFALLAAGESDQDERIQKAIHYLEGTDAITGTYALGLHAQIFPLLPSSKFREHRVHVQHDGNILLRGLRQSGEARGLYHYTPDDPGWDLSASQFGVLGMWACAQLGFEVPTRYWQEVENAWIAHQDKSGGWHYSDARMERPGMGRGPGGGGFPGRNGPGGRRGMGPGGFGGGFDFNKDTLSMTAAGIATLFITQDYLHSEVACKGNYVNAPVEAGLNWISKHFDELSDDRHYYYTLFGISRIGLASGYKYFGSKDWYREGAAQLVAAQLPNGSWEDSVSDTSFALLFLVRGRAPVLMNKLEYSIAPLSSQGAAPTLGNWNQRARDAANVTQWVSRQMERNLNWQVVNLSVPPEELHDAPILYLAGNQTLNFSQADEAKLKTFVEEGGMILGNADCGSKLFADSFKKLGQTLFGKYEFRTLPANHLIYTGEMSRPGKKPPVPLEGLSNGCRELMILIPTADPPRYWQTRTDVGKEEFHQIMSNIYVYAVEKSNARYKGDTYIVLPDPHVVETSSIKVARIEAGDNWNPEPGGWTRLAAVLRNHRSIHLTTEAVRLEPGKLDGYTVAHWTGTAKVNLSAAQRAELKHFVDAGGTLIVDSAGGSTQFASSAEAELIRTFGDDPAFQQPLPPDHPLYSAGGQKLVISYRPFAREALVGKLKSPRLRGFQIKGRLAVIFSAEDLSEGLVGEPVDGILGYEPETATSLMSAMLLYSQAGHSPSGLSR